MGGSKKEGIKITLLANGCKWKEWEERKEKPKKKVKKNLSGLSKVPQLEISQTPAKEKSEEIKKTEDYNSPTALPPERRAPVKIKVRKNALEIKKSIEEEEKKILAQESKWEVPAFLRHKPSQIEDSNPSS